MAEDKKSFLLRLEPEWKLLGNTLTKALNLSANQVIADLYKGWILQKLSELTNTDYADSPEGLQAAAEALLKYRDDVRVKDAADDAELLQYLNRCKEIQSERQIAELQRLNQQEEERKNLERKKNLRERYSELSDRLSDIFLQIIPEEDLISINSIWIDNIPLRYEAPEGREAFTENLSLRVVNAVSDIIQNTSLISEDISAAELKEEAISIVKESRTFTQENIIGTSFFAAYHKYQKNKEPQYEEEEENLS